MLKAYCVKNKVTTLLSIIMKIIEFVALMWMEKIIYLEEIFYKM